MPPAKKQFEVNGQLYVVQMPGGSTRVLRNKNH